MDSVSRRQLAEIIAKKMTRMSSKKLSRELAAYLLAEKRSAELQSLMRDVVKARARQGTIEATATSAHELSTQIQSELKKLASDNQKGHVLLNLEHDQSAVGGARLETADIQLDLTIRGRLKSLTNLQSERT